MLCRHFVCKPWIERPLYFCLLLMSKSMKVDTSWGTPLSVCIPFRVTVLISTLFSKFRGELIEPPVQAVYALFADLRKCINLEIEKYYKATDAECFVGGPLSLVRLTCIVLSPQVNSFYSLHRPTQPPCAAFMQLFCLSCFDSGQFPFVLPARFVLYSIRSFRFQFRIILLDFTSRCKSSQN